MIRKCPDCTKKTTFDYCKECQTPTLPMEKNRQYKTKKILTTGSDKSFAIPRKHKYDLHKMSYKFILYSSNFKGGALRQMKNWTYREVKQDGFTIHITPKKLIIWKNSRTKTTDPLKAEQEIKDEITSFAINFAKDNNIEINEKPIPHTSEVKTDITINRNFETPKVFSRYPIPSPLEYKYTKDAIKTTLNFDQMTELMSEFSKNISLHLETMNNINKSLASIESIAARQNLIQRLKRWFK